ncbi:MAG TPA: NADP-specific glutamate dehydrogenase [Candidatus Paceibacterota bacterium]
MNTHSILEEVQKTYHHQPTFLQAAAEFIESVAPYLQAISATDADYALVRRLLVPERVISFRVDWMDDKGVMQSNIGYRVQYNSALGPYKGGLRFDPSVNEDVLKFLGFEQIFKNALTGLRLGGGKGGSDFNPKGRSDNELRSFCRAFMLELHRHIGIERDVPAGDIGVGGREIGYLYGMYKEITNGNEGALTGKDPLHGGSLGRTEATGHGIVYFAEAMASFHGFAIAGKKAVVSGSGNVAEHTARKLISLDVMVLTLSDRSGYVFKPTGLSQSDIDLIMSEKKRGKDLSQIAVAGGEYKNGTPWQSVAAELYFPCATQNEVNEADAAAMAAHAKLIVEGANMPFTEKAAALVRKEGIPFAPGKAANAGGVSVSGLEMAQHASHYSWTAEEVDKKLRDIMNTIHAQCVENGKTDAGIDYVIGANVAGFRRVFEAMKKLGW